MERSYQYKWCKMQPDTHKKFSPRENIKKKTIESKRIQSKVDQGSSIPYGFLEKVLQTIVFIKLSTSWFLVSTCLKFTSPLSTWSLRKWFLISTCLVHECKTRFLVNIITLLLLH